ncbi:hypothetical protein AGR4C_pb30007 [Agrobacterium tumefaciens str. Kerr 14]|uniref:Uncharacterized protein n=1 Tax=Agrobacterium tumefaciens str. Kerr 14 TaxID=1183424 RepID=A0A1S7SEU3_AGRTU|nr:hypothetical protein AGR4C_pb30007 [Agrobacterium tumefaciens str. Kerr 14]
MLRYRARATVFGAGDMLDIDDKSRFNESGDTTKTPKEER